MKSAADLIYEIRKKEGLSQEDFAKKLGYSSKSTINKIEKGINEISYEKLIKLIEEYHLTYKDFQDNKPAEIKKASRDSFFLNTADLKTDEIFLKLIKTEDAQKEKKYVPSYFFYICLIDGTVVGSCQLRVGHNENTYYGGNIGYEIKEEYRGHRYAVEATKLLLVQAKKHNMKYVIITCNPTNIASSKTCLLSGASLIETAKIPDDNEMNYRYGRKESLIYRIDL